MAAQQAFWQSHRVKVADTVLLQDLLDQVDQLLGPQQVPMNRLIVVARQDHGGLLLLEHMVVVLQSLEGNLPGFVYVIKRGKVLGENIGKNDTLVSVRLKNAFQLISARILSKNG